MTACAWPSLGLGDSAAASGQCLESSSGYTLAFFTAVWCGPCKPQASAFDQVSNGGAYQNQGVSFVTMDIDEKPDCEKTWKLLNIPTIILIKDGQELGRLNGIQREQQLKAFLDNHLSD